MEALKVVAVLATGLMLSGCDGMPGGMSAASGQNAYGAPDYYGAPAYPGPDYYGQPGYGSSSYQRVYVAPYGRDRGFEGGHDRDWREHNGRALRNEGREPMGQQRQDVRQTPQMAPPSHSFSPPAPRMDVRPPPAASPQVEQNKRLIDQLGFRPTR